MSSKVLSGRYALQEKIGVGGMATVYKAFDQKENRTVAVKILDNKMINDQQKINIFFREVEVMSRIKHENCVRIYDHGIYGSIYYIVMEFVNGVTLQKIIQNSGKLGPSKAVKYAVQILAALNEAHKNKIIHRDIKPQNILVDKNGNIKVADFGISRLIDAKSHSINNNDTVLGSVHYVSPEQAQGEEVDQRSDLYSAGIVLYEMLTGHPPFDADNPVKLVMMHCQQAPEPMRTRNKGVSVGLDEVVLKALSKKREERYETAADMARDLKKALKHPEGGVVAYQTRRERFAEYIHKNGQNVVLILFSIFTVIGILGYGCGKVVDVMFKVDVPYVTRELYEDAVAKLKDAGLDAVVEYVYTDDSSRDMVITQDPSAGSRVNRNRDVKLVVSVGLEPVNLPDVTGMRRTKALQLLSECGFPEVSIEYAYDAASDKDTVLSQTPETGLTSPNNKVTLRINTEPVELPVLCGKSLPQVLDILESLNLTARVITAYAPDETPDTVLLQSPAPGEKLLRGTTVTIIAALDADEIYYCDYNIRVPLDIHVSATLVSPSGLSTVVYDDDATMDKIIALKLSSAEAGAHTLTVKYGDSTTLTETLEFE